MSDLDKALAAAREALDTHRVNTSDYCVSVRYIEWAEVVERLLATLDAARGQAVAWQARLKIAGCERWTEWGEVDDIEHFKRFHAERGNACEVRALYAAPPAAAVPEGYALVPVQSLRWWRELAEINPQDLVPRIDAVLAAANKENT